MHTHRFHGNEQKRKKNGKDDQVEVKSIEREQTANTGKPKNNNTR